MTKSTITRERVVALIAEHSYDSALVDALEHLLAAIDSEPVSQKEPISFDEWSRKCALQITLCYPDFREKAKYIWDSARETQHVAPALVDDVSIFEAAIEECKKCDSIDEHAWNHGVLAVIAEYESCRAAMLQASNSPAQSDCCPAQNHVSPEQNGDTPAQNQGWIPLSEQMPPSRHEVLVGCWWGEKPRWCCKWAAYIPGHPDAQSSGWLIPGASWTPTHWMPLPAAPQEVKGE